MPQKIASLDELKALCKKDKNWPDFGRVECFITLNGEMKSGKDITYYPGSGQQADLGDDPEWPTDVFSEHGLVGEGASREGLKVNWHVFHSIDDTYVEYTDDAALLGQTMLGGALEKGALYSY